MNAHLNTHTKDTRGTIFLVLSAVCLGAAVFSLFALFGSHSSVGETENLLAFLSLAVVAMIFAGVSVFTSFAGMTLAALSALSAYEIKNNTMKRCSAALTCVHLALLIVSVVSAVIILF